MQYLKHGVLIAVEGIDGSGKSSLIKNLQPLFEKDHIPVLVTKQPGGTALGKEVRHMVQTQPIPISSKAEYLLFAADRAQHMQEVIEPALKKKLLVISDRMGDSSLAYQGYGRGLEIEMLATINAWAMNNRKPDLTIYVAIDLETACARLAQRGLQPTAFEAHTSFIKKVIDGYEKLYRSDAQVMRIDGSQPEEMVARNTHQQVLTWLHEHNFR